MRLIKQLLVALVIASLLEGWWSCDGCLENERNALLQLKASFNYPERMSLSSWGLYTDDCCKWENIHCSSTTGRVSKLSILHDYWTDEWTVEWCFNASLFLPFQELTSLSLNNLIIDCVENGDFERLERLSKLEFLDLEGNLFNNKSIVSSIGHLSSLKSLNLGDTGLESVTDIQGLSSLQNLEFLDLSSNDFNNSIIPFLHIFPSLKSLNLDRNRLQSGIQELSGFENLEFLDLSFNNFGDSIIPFLRIFPSLKSLKLAGNRLESGIQGLSGLENLEFLDLSSNNFNKSIIPLLSVFSSLKSLTLIDNRLENITNFQGLSKLSNLEFLDLSLNDFGNSTLSSIGDLSSLKELHLDECGLRGTFDIQKLDALGNLKVLSLRRNQITKVVDSRDLDISDNYFNGSIPTEIGLCFPSLNFLNLSGNGLTGGIPSSFGKMSQLTELDLSNNRLSGIIPQDLIVGCNSLGHLILSNNNLQGQIFPKQATCKELIRLLLDGNQFTGSIPYSISNCTMLKMLDVSYNRLFGSIPGWIGNITSLNILDLSENSFFGNLPSSFVPPWISEVYLSKNRLQGPLTNAFYGCSALKILDLSQNDFTKRIPEWIGNFSRLTYLLLGYNRLEGEIPIQLCHLFKLRLVDFSNNNLSGPVPPCISLRRYSGDGIRYLRPPIGSMTQPLEVTTKNALRYFQGSILSLMSGLDLSCNNLTGEIPFEIGNLDKIQLLNLSHNKLTGLIPQSFSNLTQIESLDLSYNNLNGKIPQLTQLYSLAVFSVAHNNLSGKTPEMVAQFGTFENRSYEGNPFLCGPPLSKSCSSSSIMPRVSEEDRKDHKKDGGFIDMYAFYVSFMISYAIMLLTMAAVLYINPHWRRAWFYMIELSLSNFYYFLVDNIPFVFRCY